MYLCAPNTVVCMLVVSTTVIGPQGVILLLPQTQCSPHLTLKMPTPCVLLFAPLKLMKKQSVQKLDFCSLYTRGHPLYLLEGQN